LGYNNKLYENYRIEDYQITMKDWNNIKWTKVSKIVEKLQHKIYTHSMQRNHKLVHKYQQILLNTTYSKLLAVRKVTQDNRGKKGS